jgi:uncharacterized membrane protein YebE (DUF533 family)
VAYFDDSSDDSKQQRRQQQQQQQQQEHGFPLRGSIRQLLRMVVFACSHDGHVICVEISSGEGRQLAVAPVQLMPRQHITTSLCSK